MAIRMNAQAKYYNTPTVVDGIRFASKAESRRYSELKLLEKAGQIRGLRLQPDFNLCAWRPDHSECPIVGIYRGDFYYEERQSNVWRSVVEDVKGFRTQIYEWKKRHMKAQYNIDIREVK